MQSTFRGTYNPCRVLPVGRQSSTWLAMLVMNDLTSMDVGHDSWHGACAHLRQRRASRTAARSPPRNVLGLTSVHQRFNRPLAHPSTAPTVSCPPNQHYIINDSARANAGIYAAGSVPDLPEHDGGWPTHLGHEYRPIYRRICFSVIFN